MTHKRTFSECYEQSLDLISKILMQKETEWIANNQEFLKILEFMMTESLRRGLSQHVAEVTPCVAYDLQKLMTLCNLALG